MSPTEVDDLLRRYWRTVSNRDLLRATGRTMRTLRRRRMALGLPPKPGGPPTMPRQKLPVDGTPEKP